MSNKYLISSSSSNNSNNNDAIKSDRLRFREEKIYKIEMKRQINNIINKNESTFMSNYVTNKQKIIYNFNNEDNNNNFYYDDYNYEDCIKKKNSNEFNQTDKKYINEFNFDLYKPDPFDKTISFLSGKLNS